MGIFWAQRGESLSLHISVGLRHSIEGLLGMFCNSANLRSTNFKYSFFLGGSENFLTICRRLSLTELTWNFKDFVNRRQNYSSFCELHIIIWLWFSQWAFYSQESWTSVLDAHEMHGSMGSTPPCEGSEWKQLCVCSSHAFLAIRKGCQGAASTRCQCRDAGTQLHVHTETSLLSLTDGRQSLGKGSLMGARHTCD